MKDDYSDIIGLPRPVSKRHPQMPLQNRAAQFMPFAALSGFNEVLKDAEKAVQRSFEHEVAPHDIDVFYDLW